MAVPYSRIMLAIDQDDVSHEALSETIYFARIFQAKLLIVHVVDEAILSDFQESSIHEELTALEKSNQAFLEALAAKAHHAGINTETKLLKVTKRSQHIAFEIVTTAKEWSADLLVIGAYSRPGFHKLLFGHVAESIIRITNIPVLVIHTQRIKM
jgi:nucleotide-binding universal stress UspA family protein